MAREPLVVPGQEMRRSGAPTASLTTTRNNSIVLGVGNDWDSPLPRVPGTNQMLLHQSLASSGDTYWMQMRNAPIPTSGTAVTINDTSPTTDRYNLTIAEIPPVTRSDIQRLWNYHSINSGKWSDPNLGRRGDGTATANGSGGYSFLVC